MSVYCTCDLNSGWGGNHEPHCPVEQVHRLEEEVERLTNELAEKDEYIKRYREQARVLTEELVEKHEAALSAANQETVDAYGDRDAVQRELVKVRGEVERLNKRCEEARKVILNDDLHQIKRYARVLRDRWLEEKP